MAERTSLLTDELLSEQPKKRSRAWCKICSIRDQPKAQIPFIVRKHVSLGRWDPVSGTVVIDERLKGKMGTAMGVATGNALRRLHCDEAV